MLRRIIQVLVIVPLAVVIVVFSVANRHAVTISLDPFNGAEPALSLSLPLFLIVLGTLFIGVVVGGVAAWLSQGKWRQRARLSREEAARWRNRADEAARKEADASGAPRLPALKRSA
ncbi:LapA family protein [Microbaculum marinisediminis]|uniref:LapA family protein n=1 Tax=Microbaculum marinisediminis TaxID=2931392 RepID=A0AAW5R2C7_9HYPH|nr:LapA family protein [Microbaculum sp. A6E488]MCT8973287.1 LapA family protein [Microbaculum sp. A6E488]